MAIRCNALVAQRGFTLVELAIVMFVVALLLGGMMMPLSAQQDIRYVAETQKTLSNIQDALTGFAAANGRLPCPAPATQPSGSATAGVEPTPIVSSGCATVAGVLPWATLGVSETDAWGRRFTYRVTQEFTRTSPQTTFNGSNCPLQSQNAGFALCSIGDMNVYATDGGSSVARNIPAVVISHGKNGNGAYTPNGTQLAVGSDVDEKDNHLTPSGTATLKTDFISKTPTSSFDDLVVWLSPNIIANRMITAGKLP
jgi:prepilin-type N-terminal cleavage/methylation domain-containing protein